ncbi:HAMP domain-containing sensor histidine kinase [Coleofasciculus sp. FACHB-SPT9]
MPLNRFAKTVSSVLARVQQAGNSAEYQAWRCRFMLNRLHWFVWIAIIACLTFLILGLCITSVLNASDNPNEAVSQEENLIDLMIYITIELSLLLCLILLKSPWASRYPKRLFLCCSWSITLLPQIQATLQGKVDPVLIAWTIVFPAQATLIPVNWQLHLVSQVTTIGYYFCVKPLLGLSNPEVENPVLHNIIIFVFYFWICLICDLGVCLYERLHRSEFESKRQSQVFLHGVSHDLRNPVIGTLMVLNNLLQKPDATIAIPRSILERMVQGSDHQLQLINSLLEAHANDVQGIVLHTELIQLSGLVSSSVADLEPILEQNQAMLKNLVPEDLPLVAADSTQLWRVFSNLITNAIKHNPSGLMITLSATAGSKMIRCSIEDNGVGMSEEQCKRLFELYFRSSHIRNSLGLGLGLYLCRQIIHAHGGEIGVISFLGTGTKFWFTIPIKSYITTNTTPRSLNARTEDGPLTSSWFWSRL